MTSKTNVAPASISFDWQDLDDLFNDDSADALPLPDLFNTLVSRQIEEHGDDLKAPCAEASELVAQWSKDLEADCLQMWRAAVARYKKSKPQAVAGPAEGRMNDAEILGQDHPDMSEILAKPFTFMTGDLYGQRDRRNTQDGDWKAVTAPLINWMVGGEGKNGKGVWGLTRHPVGREKGGPSIVPSFNLDGARKDAAVETMYAIVLDIDSGESLDETIDKLIEQGLFALVYTTFSHGKTEVELKHDDIMRKLGLEDSPTRPEIQEYLRLHHSGRYDRDFIAQIEVVDARRQTTNGMLTVIKTPAIDKFRVVLPLWEPVKLADLAPTLQKWKDVWADAVTGVAVNMLDVNFDSSSTDVNRLFYTPRHPKGDENWYSAVIQGRPLRFEEIKPYSKDKFLRQRTAPGDPFLADTDGSSGASDVPLCMAPSGMVLNQWHREAKDRFMIADVLETYCGDKLADADNKPGSVHIQCPFEHEHSSTGGSGTLAVNALDSDSEYWTVFCLHDSCKGRHKLEFLQEMLAQEWFPESILKDSSFLLPPADGEELAKPGDVAASIKPTATDEDIRALARKLHKDCEDSGFRGRLATAVKERGVGQTKADVRKLIRDGWLEGVKAAKKKKPGASQDYPLVDLAEGHRTASGKVREVMVDQGDAPILFHAGGKLSDIREDENGNLSIAVVGQDRLKAFIEERLDFLSDEGKNVAAPQAVVNKVAHMPLTEFPPLRRLVCAPIYGKDMSLVQDPGYHVETGLYYQPKDNVTIPPIPDEPTPEEVQKAVLDLADLVADFCLGGKTRDELMRDIKNGEDVASFAHLLSWGLTVPCRDMIDGPTPNHLARKMYPRTGATLLMTTFGYISCLQHPAAMTLPEGRGETSKTLTSVIDGGRGQALLDNIPEGMETESDEVATAITAWPTYTARRLGVIGMVEAVVKTVWGMTGNKTRLSPQLAERTLLIELDPKTENPGARDKASFKYNLTEHVAVNAAKYLHALLTLVQNWIAKGCPEWKGNSLGGFEAHARVVGGILDAAGVHGFMKNRAKLATVAKVAGPETVLKDAMIEAFHAVSHGKPGVLFRTWGTQAPMPTIRGKDGKLPDDYTNYHVVSVHELLEDHQIAVKNLGWQKDPDNPAGGIIYPDTAKAGISTFVSSDLEGGVREWGETECEEEEKQGRYVLERLGTDKHGALYKLTHLPPINLTGEKSEEAA